MKRTFTILALLTATIALHPALAEEPYENLPMDPDSVKCRKLETADCLDSDRFKEECGGKVRCIIRKCRNHATSVCTWFQ